MNAIRTTRHSDLLEARRPRDVSRDTLLPWADPYIADLQRIDSPAASWPDRPHFERHPAAAPGRLRGEAAPPLGEFPLSRSDEGGRRS